MSAETARQQEETPLISVIMPAYNCFNTLGEAVDSVRHQTFAGWELLIVDDGSTDRTQALAREYTQSDFRIKLLSNTEHTGNPAAPRNLGLDAARGEFVAFLDADDVWDANKLERQLEYLTKQQLDLCGTWVKVINASGEQAGYRRPATQVSFESLLKHNTLVCSSVLMKSCWTQDQRFPSLGHEDYAYWLGLIRLGARAGVMPEVLVSYRVHKDSLSANKLKVISFFWRIYREQEQFSFCSSLYFTLRYLLLASWRVVRP